MSFTRTLTLASRLSETRNLGGLWKGWNDRLASQNLFPQRKMSTVTCTKNGSIAQVELSRPAQGNAMNAAFWKEFRETFQALAKDTEVRCIILSGQGKFFTVGLDIKDTSLLALPDDADSARKAFHMRNKILEMQETFNVIEKCPQPVIACVHNACIGGGIDMICACDIRLCTKDAFFSIKEVDIGLAADVGTLQRIQHVIGSSSLVRDLAYTARRMPSDEAHRYGFVSQMFETKDEMLKYALQVANTIASKSPVAIMGTKHNLNHSRGKSVGEALEYMATWNAAMLQTDDLASAAIASLKKQSQPEFSKL